VEKRDRPDLAARPVIVGGGVRGDCKNELCAGGIVLN
jgi:hypothetical protein